MSIQESGEMYLESILILSKKKSYVRSVDVSEYMNYSKPSVSRAVNLLRDGGYLNIDQSGHLTLTELGREIAEKIYDRHTYISAFFVALGVDPETATEDACRIEHVISDASFQAIKNIPLDKIRVKEADA